jgi:hypothetical protein
MYRFNILFLKSKKRFINQQAPAKNQVAIKAPLPSHIPVIFSFQKQAITSKTVLGPPT